MTVKELKIKLDNYLTENYFNRERNKDPDILAYDIVKCGEHGENVFFKMFKIFDLDVQRNQLVLILEPTTEKDIESLARPRCKRCRELATKNILRHLDQSESLREIYRDFIKENPDCSYTDLEDVITDKIIRILYSNTYGHYRDILPLLEDIIYFHFNYENIDYQKVLDYFSNKNNKE